MPMEGDSRPSETEPPTYPLISAGGKRRRWIGLLLVGALGLAGVVFAALHLGEISAFAAQAAKSEPKWLATAAASQLATYAGVAFVWSRVLSTIGKRLSVGALYPLSVAKLFADQAIPSGGVSGAVFFFHALGRRGVPHRLAFAVFVFTTAAFFAAFLTASMVSFFAVATADDAPPALAASIAAFAAIVLLLFFLSFVLFVLRPAIIMDWLSNIPKFQQAAEWLTTAKRYIASERRLFFEATVIQFGVRMIDGLTLYFALLAIGGSAPYLVCFFAVVMASVAATIGPAPMGLGAFEAGMIATLKLFDTPIEDALTATLIFRGLSLWLPLAPGFFIIQREIMTAKRHD